MRSTDRLSYKKPVNLISTGFTCSRAPAGIPASFRPERTKNPRFPNRKPEVSHPDLPDGNSLISGGVAHLRMAPSAVIHGEGHLHMTDAAKIGKDIPLHAKCLGPLLLYIEYIGVAA